MDIEEFRKQGYAAIDAICDYYASLETTPVRSSVAPNYLTKLIGDHAPVEGEKMEAIAADFQSIIMPGITHWQSPKFFAYFPANASFAAILGELYSQAISNPGFNWSCSPAATELEGIAMDWSTRMLGLSDDFLTLGGVGGGVISGSASEACLTVAIGARERALRVLTSLDVKAKGVEPIAGHSISPSIRETHSQKLVMYVSSQTHSIGSKAALILGLTVRVVEVTKEDGFALRGDVLRKVIQADVDAGLVPFFVIGTVGTTSSGAVDKIGEIGIVVKEFPTIHYHIDSAWAGVSFACPEFRDVGRLDEINKYADTFSTNFHKWGLVNFDCCGLWVRDRKLLTSALDITPEFLRTEHGDTGAVIDYRNWQISLGRRFRSLKLWFVLRNFGVKGFQSHIRHSVELAGHLTSLVKSDPNFALVAPPSLALVVFRLEPAGVPVESLNDLNKTFFAKLMARTDILLTQTMLPGNIFCVRWAIGTPSTTSKHIDEAWASVLEESTAAIANIA